MNKKTLYLVQAALIAAVYAVLTYALAPISYGPLQFRVSEALTVLPAIFPAAVPGLFVGCIVSNLVGGLGLWDIVIGSLATLIAAYLTSKLRNKWLVPAPPVIVNAVIIGIMLSYMYKLPTLATISSVGVGEMVVCYLLGVPLYLVFLKNKRRFGIDDSLDQMDSMENPYWNKEE